MRQEKIKSWSEFVACGDLSRVTWIKLRAKKWDEGKKRFLDIKGGKIAVELLIKRLKETPPTALKALDLLDQGEFSSSLDSFALFLIPIHLFRAWKEGCV